MRALRAQSCRPFRCHLVLGVSHFPLLGGGGRYAVALVKTAVHRDRLAGSIGLDL
jgi:hypothetical protein